MSCTEISSIVAYNPKPITNRCGEVHCCEKLENFSIYCGSCPQQFNLLSCTLFIKHIKECKSMVFQNFGEQNFSTQDICNYTTDNLLKDASTSNNIDSSGGVNTEVPHIDPLMHLKLEIIKEKDEPQLCNEPVQDEEYLSDYVEEDELSLEKVISRKKIKGIINEYRKHPILWDPRMSRSTTSTEKMVHYRQITRSVNLKFKMNLRCNELQQQILELRQAYKRVLKRKNNFDFTESSTKFNSKLWYFKQLTFIQGLSNDIEVELPSLDESNYNLIAKQENSDSETEPISKKQERDNYKTLNDPNIISDLIAQYKQYPFLWDQTVPLYNCNYTTKKTYLKITAYINKKFNKNITYKDVKQQIVKLCNGYRRVQRTKGNADCPISLWYYDDLSFIDRQTNEENVIPIEVDVPENLDEEEDSIIEYQPEESEAETDEREETNEAEIILALIEEYKEHPCLYNNYRYNTNCRFSRAEAIDEILTNINNKFNTSFTEVDIKARISKLRSSYRRNLRTKEGFEKLHANAKRKFHPKWKYFDKMSFIDTKESDLQQVHLKKKEGQDGKTKKEKEDTAEFEDEDTITDKDDSDNDNDTKAKNDPIHHDEKMSVDTDDGEKSDKLFKIEFLTEEDEDQPIKFAHLSDHDEDVDKNWKTMPTHRVLLTAIIDEYKKLPCLWAVKHYTNNNTYRRKAFELIAKNVNNQLNTSYNYKDISSEIVKLRASYKRMAKRKQDDPTYESKLWYADKLSFIEGKGQEGNGIPSYANESEDDNMEEIFNKKYKIKSKEMVYQIIELYKRAPMLWNTSHPMHTLRTERRKAVKQIIETLAREHDCVLTLDEFRYHIRYLKNSYYRTLRQENAGQADIANSYIPRPFFFDRLSFLEPYAETFPITVHNLNSEVSKPVEDFSYLVENKPLMIDFIEVYKEYPCLWDAYHKDKKNLQAHSEAYDRIISTFLKYNITLSKDDVLTAIRFLHFSYVKQQKNNDVKLESENTNEPHIWFYDHLLFLRKIRKNIDKHCSHCDQNFITLAEYEKHKIEIAGDYPYKCSVCSAGFISRSKYVYHQNTHKEPHKCDQCDFQAYDKHNFNVHMRRHKGITPFKCSECGKGFVTSTELIRHTRMHTGERPYICDICGKSLTSNSEFRVHKKKHSNQRDHKCDMCGSAFYTPKGLRDHMATHSNERAHVCEICGAAFKRRKTLLQHEALHADIKKHECKICGKMFAQKAGVYSHMKSHGLMAGS